MVKRRSPTPHTSTAACGVWPFLLPSTDPFHSACVWHDKAYDYLDWTEGTQKIDYKFLSKMLTLAGTNKKLRKRAYRFYRIARRWGQMRWFLANKFGIYPKGSQCRKE